jgi:hypothetical protein
MKIAETRLRPERWAPGSTARQSTKKGGVTKMAMDIILELQKLEVPQEEDLFGNSTGSSQTNCCNGRELDA